jgi:hypothetical protein
MRKNRLYCIVGIVVKGKPTGKMSLHAKTHIHLRKKRVVTNEYFTVSTLKEKHIIVLPQLHGYPSGWKIHLVSSFDKM